MKPFSRLEVMVEDSNPRRAKPHPRVALAVCRELGGLGLLPWACDPAYPLRTLLVDSSGKQGVPWARSVSSV